MLYSFSALSELVNIEKYGIIKAMRYTSDLTDAQWEQIKEYFPAYNKSKYDKSELIKRSIVSEEKTKGRKRHIVTDTLGNLLCVHVHAANIHDTKGGAFTFEKALYRYPAIIAEGYRGTFKITFEIQPLRWKVEWTFSWFQSSR